MAELTYDITATIAPHVSKALAEISWRAIEAANANRELQEAIAALRDALPVEED